MGFTDIFKGKQYKAELDNLQQQNNDLRAMMTPEMQNAVSLQSKIRELESAINQNNSKIYDLNNEIDKRKAEISKLDGEITSKKSEIIYLDDEILVQDFGLYKPQFDFANSLGYKEKLSEIRNKQK